MLGKNIRFTQERLDPSTVNRFLSQRLDSGGETTGLKFYFEFGLPCWELKPFIDTFWVSYPENFGSALDNCSALSLVNNGLRT